MIIKLKRLAPVRCSAGLDRACAILNENAVPHGVLTLMLPAGPQPNLGSREDTVTYYFLVLGIQN